MKARYYYSFPLIKALNGLVLDIGKNNPLGFRYIYYPDTVDIRYFLIDNNYFNAEYIYIGWLRRWVSKDIFFTLISNNEYQKDKLKAYERYKKYV